MGMSASKRQESGILGMTKKLREKWNEALQAVLPIIAIVLVLCFVIAPISSSILLCFLLGAVLLLAGMMLFTLGAELAMSPMGERVGTCLTKSRKLPVVIGLSFLLGFIITISEPDLQVLANQVPAVLVRSMRSRRISCCGTAANAVLRGTSAVAACLLWRGVCTGDVRAEGFFKRGL